MLNCSPVICTRNMIIILRERVCRCRRPVHGWKLWITSYTSWIFYKRTWILGVRTKGITYFMCLWVFLFLSQSPSLLLCWLVNYRHTFHILYGVWFFNWPFNNTSLPVDFSPGHCQFGVSVRRWTISFLWIINSTIGSRLCSPEWYVIVGLMWKMRTWVFVVGFIN